MRGEGVKLTRTKSGNWIAQRGVFITIGSTRIEAIWQLIKVMWICRNIKNYPAA
jgi:hypothetical protein